MPTNTTGGPSDRPRRPPHSHIAQSPRSPVTGCTACALIRPEAMELHPYAIEGLSAAGQLPPVPTPEASP